MQDRLLKLALAVNSSSIPKPIKTKATLLITKAYKWGSERSLARIQWETRIRRKMQIAWAYDGALTAGRDQEWWLQESYCNLLTALTGGIPPHIAYQVMLDDPKTPWDIRAKLTALKASMGVVRKWQGLPRWRIAGVCLLVPCLFI